MLRRNWRLPALVVLLALGWLVYLPGLSGSFLFDDYVNLNAIGAFGRVDDWPTFWRYITSGKADPLGRPLALLSFLLDARDWPAAAEPFLRTNVLLHLGNGALLFLLLRKLGSELGDSRDNADAAALLGTALWLLHPLLVSTTLYAVQREAMLPATFMLASLLAYAHGRSRYAATGGTSGGAWMLAAILIGTPLAALSKANGVLLPVLALVLEATVFAPLPATSSPEAQARLRRLRTVLLLLPSLLVLLLLAWPLTGGADPVGNRPWSAPERLLTQPRVLVDYLWLLLAPRSISGGLFNDSFVHSTSLLSPATTLPALLVVFALVGFALWQRRQAPALAAALLFFFGAHLLESTTLPLELYFEHRNYLPALLLPWPLARALCAWRRPLALRVAIGLALVALVAVTCVQRTSLWGDPQRMAAVWASRNQQSARAQAVASIADMHRQRPELALARLGPLLAQRPHDLQIAFNYVDARCATTGLVAGDAEALSTALRKAPAGALMVTQWLATAIRVATDGQCRGLELSTMEEWLRAAEANPLNRGAEDIAPLHAELALARGLPREALRYLDQALASQPSPGLAARQAATLASFGYYEQALAHLDTLDRLGARRRKPGAGMGQLHAFVLERQQYWPREIALLRSRLQQAIEERDSDR